jgi:hypothetical protein
MRTTRQNPSWTVTRMLVNALVSLAASGLLSGAVWAQTDFNSEQGPGAGVFGPGPGCNLFPASPSVGASVPLSYFGPPPSESNPSLVGPVQLLRSGTVDATKGTITLPLYLGYMAGSNTKVWYILTDVDDQEVATLLGLNFSAKLTFAANGARTANFDSQGRLIFDHGTVDFSPDRRVVPGPADAPFPPVEAQPGAVGSADYSPLVRVLNAGGVIYNAPIVAFGVAAADITFPNGGVDYRKVHDEVVAIDPSPGKQTVTLSLVNGFSFGRPVWYLTMDCSTPTCAAIEHNTFAPLLQQIVTGFDDSFPSPVERIFIATNGPSEGDATTPNARGSLRICSTATARIIPSAASRRSRPIIARSGMPSSSSGRPTPSLKATAGNSAKSSKS